MKCQFGFTPNPECTNCGGDGIFADDGVDQEACIFCLEDAILRGEIDGTIGETAYVGGVVVITDNKEGKSV